MPTRVPVAGHLLTWARERSGLPADQLTARFPKLEAWERGESKPTLKQLEQYAHATHTPVGYFFLPEPPVEPLPMPDFRTFRDQPVRAPSPDLLETIFQCQQRQDWYREYAVIPGEDPVHIVGSLSTATRPAEAANLIRAALRFEVGERGPSWSEAFRRLAGHAEDVGVLVMVSGIVGSNTHRKLDPAEFRGFTLVDAYAPLAFVNGADSKAAQIFTLTHELAHIWSGHEGLDNADPASAHGLEVEQWCNAVAAEILVPAADLRPTDARDLTPEVLDRLAAGYRVSTLVVLRRFHDGGYIGTRAFWDAYGAESDRVAAFLQEREVSPGGNFYNTQPMRTSKRFARALISDTLEGRTLYQDAFRMLGFTKQATFDELARRMGVA